MQNGILRFVLNLLKERAGALLGLVGKGLDALRSLLKSARGLLGPLVKRAISWVMSKIAPSASAAGDKAQGSLVGLQRMAHAAMQGDLAPPPEPEPEEPEESAEEASDETGSDAVSALDDEASGAVSGDTATESLSDPTEAPPPHATPVGAQPLGYAGSARGAAELAKLAPAIGRALVRALSRRRVPYSGEPPCMQAAA